MANPKTANPENLSKSPQNPIQITVQLHLRMSCNFCPPNFPQKKANKARNRSVSVLSAVVHAGVPRRASIVPSLHVHFKKKKKEKKKKKPPSTVLVSSTSQVGSLCIAQNPSYSKAWACGGIAPLMKASRLSSSEIILAGSMCRAVSEKRRFPCGSTVCWSCQRRETYVPWGRTN